MAERRAWPAAVLLGLAACTAPDDSGVVGDDTAPPSSCALTDDNNYAYAGTIDAPTVRTRSAVDLSFDWSGLAEDLQCHPLDPVADIDNLAILAFPGLSEAEVEAGLTDGSLTQEQVGIYANVPVDNRTDAALSELTFNLVDIDIEQDLVQGYATWMALVTTGTIPGAGARALVFVEPHDDEANTDVAIDDACGSLQLDANLDALTPARLPAAGPWPLDWFQVRHNGQGLPLSPSLVDRVFVGHYPDLTADQLAAQFLDLELLAEPLYVWSVSGTTDLDLATPTDAGEAFPGFDDVGTWILALGCTTCANPAPLFLTVVDPI